VPTTSAGPNITNRWDTTGRLTETKLVNGGTTFNRHAYALNAAHQRTQQTRPDSTYVDYSYDDAGQVATALSYYSGGSPITTEQLGYGYDAAQNLTKRTNNATVTTYSVNSLNQVTGDGMLSFGYDGNGNRSSQSSGGASVTYTYDDENQLVQAETDTVYTPTGSRWKTVWAYDARGRVRVREDYSWYGPGSYFIRDRSARHLYDGMRVIQERNENNTPQVTYTRGLDLAGSWERAGGIGGLLARTTHSGANGVTYTPAFYHADGNGNVTYLLKLDQTAGANYQFDPFGRLLASSGTLAAANTYRFSSKEVMLASGFYSFGYRFYDPATQRWLNRDPIGEDGGVNLYGYVGNNSISGVDAFGLWSWDNDLLQKGAPQLWNDFWHDFFYGSNYQSRKLPPGSFGALHGIENDFNGCTASELVTELGLNAGSGLLEGLGALRFACTLKKCKSAKEASSIISKIEKLGGGYPRPSYTPKGAPQWIFPNGTVLRFDLKPGQYLKGQGPHINLEVPGNVPPNIHIPVKP